MLQVRARNVEEFLRKHCRILEEFEGVKKKLELRMEYMPGIALESPVAPFLPDAELARYAFLKSIVEDQRRGLEEHVLYKARYDQDVRAEITLHRITDVDVVLSISATGNGLNGLAPMVALFEEVSPLLGVERQTYIVPEERAFPSGYSMDEAIKKAKMEFTEIPWHDLAKKTAGEDYGPQYHGALDEVVRFCSLFPAVFKMVAAEGKQRSVAIRAKRGRGNMKDVLEYVADVRVREKMPGEYLIGAETQAVLQRIGSLADKYFCDPKDFKF